MRIKLSLINTKMHWLKLHNYMGLSVSNATPVNKLSQSRVLVKSMQNSFLFRILNDKSGFMGSISRLLTILYKTNYVGFVELDLIGLGFRVRKITSNLYRFFFGRANFVYLVVRNGLFVRSYSNDSLKIRKVFLFGKNVQLVNNIAAFVLLLQQLNPYRVTGVVDPRKVIVLRSGKQR